MAKRNQQEKKRKIKIIERNRKKKKNFSPTTHTPPFTPRYNDVIANLAAALTRTSISCLSSHFGFRLVD